MNPSIRKDVRIPEMIEVRKNRSMPLSMQNKHSESSKKQDQDSDNLTHHKQSLFVKKAQANTPQAQSRAQYFSEVSKDSQFNSSVSKLKLAKGEDDVDFSQLNEEEF